MQGGRRDEPGAICVRPSLGHVALRTSRSRGDALHPTAAHPALLGAAVWRIGPVGRHRE